MLFTFAHGSSPQFFLLRMGSGVLSSMVHPYRCLAWTWRVLLWMFFSDAWCDRWADQDDSTGCSKMTILPVCQVGNRCNIKWQAMKHSPAAAGSSSESLGYLCFPVAFCPRLRKGVDREDLVTGICSDQVDKRQWTCHDLLQTAFNKLFVTSWFDQV